MRISTWSSYVFSSHLLLYEYQTMICGLTGMEVSNSSMYYGASALVEALLMAVRANKQNGSGLALVPRAVNPLYRDVVAATTPAQGIEQQFVDYDPKSGQTPLAALAQHDGSKPTAVVIQPPTFFGVLEDVDAITDRAERHRVV